MLSLAEQLSPALTVLTAIGEHFKMNRNVFSETLHLLPWS